MTEEEKAKLEAEQAEADAEAKDEESAEDDTEEEESEDDDKSTHSDKIDYEAELAKEREAREKAEKALAEKRFKFSKEKREAKPEEDEEEEEKPLTKRELQELLSEERQKTTKVLQSTRIAEIAGKYATSDAEKNLYIEIHTNRTFPEHLTLDEQMEEVYAIANRKKLIGERNEALRALKSKSGVNDNPANTHQDSPKGGEPKDSADLIAIKQVGYAWNGTTRLYEKKINGGVLVYDPKTKNTRVIKSK